MSEYINRDSLFSKCGFTGINVNTYHFCPSCGASMYEDNI